MQQWLKVIVICYVALSSSTSNSVENIKIVNREYSLPEHGTLILRVPEKWNITYYEPGTRPSPIIIFYPQEKPHPFQLTISPLWDDSIERDVTDPEFIKRYLQEVGVNVLSYSDEDQLNLIELSGKSGNGYYFQLTDSSAPEHEFKYLTQGALAVGEILLVFSYFSNDNEDNNQTIIIEMMEQAIQRHQRDVNFLY